MFFECLTYFISEMTMYGGENGKKKQPSLTEKKMQLPILSINTMSEV